MDRSAHRGNDEERSAQEELKAVLQQSLDLLDALEFGRPDGYAELQAIQDRLSSGQFRLAVLGQFKRGKSTLLNALLGDDLLPTDVLPVTAIPTFITHAGQPYARVHYHADSPPEEFYPDGELTLAAVLADYVTEKGNPNNQRQVQRVEIGHPASLLQQGVVLIDTPGIGSTHTHNTDVAYQLLPQCDAALFLVSPDPPITAVELEYLREICQRLPRTFFLLNKVDFLSDKELKDSVRFLAEQLSPLLEAPPQILSISARTALQARLKADKLGWKQSGMEQVEHNLIDFFAREKQSIFLASLRQRCQDQLEHIIMQLQLSLNSLLLPEAELQKRLAGFRQALPDIERERIAADDLLKGDLQRLEKDLQQEIEKLRGLAREKILSKIEVLVQTQADIEALERQARAALNTEIPNFFSPEMRRLTDSIQQQATALLKIHQERSNCLIGQVRKIAAVLFDIPYHAPVAATSYATFSAPGWSIDLFISDMDPLGQRLSRKLLSQRFRRRRTVKRVREESRKLLNQNVEQINWTLRRSLEESFRQYSADLAEQLEKTITATRSAMEIALGKSASHASETAAHQRQLQQTLEQLQQLQRTLPLNV
jgi:ribosome biogenesis GTPase A